MIRISLLFILLLNCTSGYSQFINGIILDENTSQPITNVHVFFNGTTIGTKTDRYGRFQLNIPGNQKLPLAVSAIGYSSLLVEEYNIENLIRILLAPKVYELDEVIISSRMSWKERIIRNQHLDVFKKQFLGQTINAYTCKILNESALVFSSSDNGNLLTVYSTIPLEISNKALGYKIIFYLDDFKYSIQPYSLTYTGYYIFSEDSTLSENARLRAEKRRRLAYLGSRMHFLRALWNNKLDSAGFTIKDPGNNIILYDSLVYTGDDSAKYLINKLNYSVAYISKVPRTKIELTHDTIYFNKLGYFDPYGIRWTGEMGKQRIADLLPYDYNLK